MGDFLVDHRDVQYGIVTGQYEPENLGFSIRNSEPGTIKYEIPLAHPFLTADQFAPYRTDWYLYRGDTSNNYTLIEAGLITEVNLSRDRDSILVSGQTWLHYLQRRMYPFDPEAYVNDHDWVSWPKKWPDTQDDAGIDLTIITEAILQAMVDEDPTGLPISFANPLMGTLGFYKIFPGDQTTIFDHVKTLSQMDEGFEFDVIPNSQEFKMYSGTRADGQQPIWYFVPANADEQYNGAVIQADWTNSGPASTWFVGYGAGSKIKKGAVSTYEPSRNLYRRLERADDFGEVSSQEMMASMAASQGYQDRFPQKKLSMTVLNPEFLSPGFYTAGRPRNIIGRRVNFFHFFRPYHTVNAEFRVQALNWNVDRSSNEEVEFELEMINNPNLT